MGRKAKASFEQKITTVKQYLDGQKSQGQLAKENNVDKKAVQLWISLYLSLGESALKPTSKNSSYTSEFKRMVVEDYLSGSDSQLGICRKYGIRSTRRIQEWILKYNSHEEIKSSRTGGKPIMTKGRNTTFEERIKIVEYCIEHNKDFNETAEKYQVSYNQARNWTIKYETSGIDALIDRRGKRKIEEQLTELDRLKAQNKLLEAKNKRLEMENELLKKLEEIERGWS